LFGEKAYSCIKPCSWEQQKEHVLSSEANPGNNRPNDANYHVQRQPPLSTLDYGSNVNNELFFIYDKHNDIEFMIDTGSRWSFLPSFKRQSSHNVTDVIRAANGSRVQVFDSVNLQVCLGMGRLFPWSFRKAAIHSPIIGIDFLKHYNLGVDAVNHTLFFIPPRVLHDSGSNFAPASLDRIHKQNVKQLRGTVNDNPSEKGRLLHRNLEPPNDNPQPAKSINDLCESYAMIFDITKFHAPTRHNTRHAIPTQGSPFCGKVRKLSPEKMNVLQRELQKLVDLDIIERSEGSPWGSPVHLVPKSEPGTYRVTGDYRQLNKQTIPDKYAIPFISDFTDNLAGKKVFSSLDLYKGYHQIEILPEHREKTSMLFKD